jgi:hypothetical protein
MRFMPTHCTSAWTKCFYSAPSSHHQLKVRIRRSCLRKPKLLGHMFTTWGVKKDELLAFPPLVEGLPLIQPAPSASTRNHHPRRSQEN